MWLDAQLPPSLAAWITATLSVPALALRDLGLRDAEDEAIFQAARAAGAVVMTKNRDFVGLVSRLGAPPKVVWLTCGNTSNANLRNLLARALPAALASLGGTDIVEVGDTP